LLALSMVGWLALAFALFTGCGDDASLSPAGDARAPDAIPRLIPPGDSDYPELEQPEQSGECAQATDCEPSCLHSCAPIPTGPVTCPVDPVPVPARVIGAECLCLGALCAWSLPGR
jgi:hypothetical protein